MIVSTVVLSILAQATAAQPAPARPAQARPAQARPTSVTKAGVQASVKAEFDRLDTNKDGYVDRAEAQKGQATSVAGRESRRQAELNQAFARLDTDKNGSVSRQEFDALLPKPQVPANTPWLTINDTNKDGRVALAEITARALGEFDRADTNHDGTINQQEFQAARRAQAQQRSAQQRPAAAPKK